MTNPPPPPPAAPNRFNLLAVLGVFVLAVIGVGFLVLGVVLLTRGPGLTAGAAPSPAPPAGGAPAPRPPRQRHTGCQRHLGGAHHHCPPGQCAHRPGVDLSNHWRDKRGRDGASHWPRQLVPVVCHFFCRRPERHRLGV